MNASLSKETTYDRHQDVPITRWAFSPAEWTGFWDGVGTLVDIAGTGFEFHSDVEIQYGFEEDARNIGQDFVVAVEHTAPHAIEIKKDGKIEFDHCVDDRRVVSKHSDRSQKW